jgi:hypothetical protein
MREFQHDVPLFAEFDQISYWIWIEMQAEIMKYAENSGRNAEAIIRI